MWEDWDMETQTPITQEMLDAVGDFIEKAFTTDAVKGLIFLQVAGGMFTVYNPAVKQALKKRWQSPENAIAYLVSKKVLEVV